MRHHYIIGYDISDPTRLRRVHKTMRDFGKPLQFSVFACMLASVERSILEAQLLKIIDTNADQVMFVRLGPVQHGDVGPPGCHTLGRPLTDGPSRSIVA